MSRILIVEDEAHIASGLRYNLEWEGHQVEWAPDGQIATQWLFEEERAYDLLVLDLMLPHVSGFEICRALRKRGHPTPILMLTAKSQDPDKVYGLRIGADDYVTKPFNLEELLARVEAILRRGDWRRAQTNDDVLAFGSVYLNFDTFEARVGDREVHLTPLEFGIMRFFRDHEGRVVSREQLLEHVWDWKSPATTRTVDNFILRLRKAFEPDPRLPRHLLSVRGAGYKFVRQ